MRALPPRYAQTRETLDTLLPKPEVRMLNAQPDMVMDRWSTLMTHVVNDGNRYGYSTRIYSWQSIGHNIDF